MTYKIEKVQLAPSAKDNRQVRFAEFVDTIRDLKVGESFVYDRPMQTTHRLAITVAQRLLKREYVVRKDTRGFRIGRLA